MLNIVRATMYMYLSSFLNSRLISSSVYFVVQVTDEIKRAISYFKKNVIITFFISKLETAIFTKSMKIDTHKH